MQAVLDAITRRFIKFGSLTVRWPDGRTTTYTGPEGSGPEASFALRDNAAIRRMVLNPTLAVGECYMDGGLIPDERGIYNVLDLLMLNLESSSQGHPIARIRSALGLLKRRLDQYNPATRAAQCGPSLRSERPALQPVPRSRPAIL